MKMWIALLLVAFAAAASAQGCGQCDTMKWATCDGPACKCTLLVGDNVKQPLDCTKLISKCYLMKAEMYRVKKGQDTRTGGKPSETAIVDNDGLYDPECESDGKFKAKQCNNTEVCWCVNSAGVRRTDKGDKNLKCEKLVETNWVRLQMKHKPVNGPVDETKLKSAIVDAIHKRYKNFKKDMVENVEYDADARLIVVDVKKPKGDRVNDLSQMAYYMEKDVKVLPLFKDQVKFQPKVGNQTLEMEKEGMLVFYVDEEAPTITMQHLSGGIIAVIVVVVLVVVAGLLALFFIRRQQNQRYNKTQTREMEAM